MGRLVSRRRRRRQVGLGEGYPPPKWEWVLEGARQGPLPRPTPIWEGDTPPQAPPLRRLQRLDTRAFSARPVPSIPKSWIRPWMVVIFTKATEAGVYSEWLADTSVI